jgi:hypothetical protein
MTPEELIRDFCCPLCYSNHMKLVVVQSTKTGQPVAVHGLYSCAGCTVVFTNPQSFVQLMQDRIIDAARYRDRKPMREYPPDAETVLKRKNDPQR